MLAGPAFAQEALTFSSGEEAMVIGSDGIRSAQQGFDQNNRPAVMIALTPKASRSFGLMTSQRIGEVLAISRCGTVLVEPRIMDAIYSGSIMITGDFTVEDATELALAIGEGAACP